MCTPFEYALRRQMELRNETFLGGAVKSRIAFCSMIAVGLLFFALGISLAADQPSKGTDLPTAQQVMDKYVKALGGHNAIFRHASMKVHGTYELSEKAPSLDRTAYY